MNLTERRMEIYSRLQEKGVVGLVDLAEEFGVSTMTIRRDLQLFQRQGFVTMSYGNAYLNRDAGEIAPSFSTKTGLELAKKQAIGKAAAEFVAEGDTIIVDAGTTTLQMLNYIGNKRLTVITNSLPVANVVGSKPNVTLIYAPGEYNEASAGLVGDLTVDFYLKLSVDKAFLGANGFDARGGANEPILADASTKRAIMRVAQECYLLIDSSKYGGNHLIRQTKLDEYDAVITDAEFPEELRPELEAVANRVIYA